MTTGRRYTLYGFRISRVMQVLYVDNHLLVVAKEAGLLVQADRTGEPDLLTLAKGWIQAKFHKPGNVFLGLVHRLDRPVSGIVVLARTSKAAARLASQFRERTPAKKYLAIVEGNAPSEGELVDWLRKMGERGSRVVSPSTPDGREARLRFRRLAARGGTSLVEVELVTGRGHQIRVQLAHAGYPIVGDLRYGARSRFDGKNLALHAYRLEIRHPVRDEALGWTAPPPDSWRGWYDAEVAAIAGSR